MRFNGIQKEILKCFAELGPYGDAKGNPSQSSQLPLLVESLIEKNKIALPSFERHSEGHNIDFSQS